MLVQNCIQLIEVRQKPNIEIQFFCGQGLLEFSEKIIKSIFKNSMQPEKNRLEGNIKKKKMNKIHTQTELFVILVKRGTRI